MKLKFLLFITIFFRDLFSISDSSRATPLIYGSHPIKLRTIYHLGLSNSSCTKKHQLNRVSHHLNQKRQEMVLPID